MRSLNMTKESLDAIGLRHGTDKASQFPTGAHSYLDRYEVLLQPIRLTAKKVLEIGIGSGPSLLTWRDYFPNANIYGVDSSPDVVQNCPTGERITTFLGDATNPKMWKLFEENWGADFDIIIDDGSHFSDEVISTFGNVFPLIRTGGLYCCEDTHCSYDGMYVRGTQSQVNFFKHLVDEMNAHGDRLIGAQLSHEPYDWIHFSKSMVVIKKR